jgi:hypothetical protein
MQKGGEFVLLSIGETEITTALRQSSALPSGTLVVDRTLPMITSFHGHWYSHQPSVIRNVVLRICEV